MEFGWGFFVAVVMAGVVILVPSRLMNNYWGLKPLLTALVFGGGAAYGFLNWQTVTVVAIMFGIIGYSLGLLENKIADLEIRHQKLFDRLSENRLLHC